MKEIKVIQGSPEWYKVRRGIPTGSEFGRIITPGTGKYAAGADTYAAELIAEAIGWIPTFQGTPDTVRGTQMEKEALNWLGFRHELKAREAGFVLSDCGRYGCSPDGLLADGSPVEVKCPALHTFLKWRIADVLPNDHKAQCHAEMHVCEADRCLFVAYADHPALDNMLIEVKRDAFTDAMGEAIDKFCTRLDELRREILGEEYEVYFPAPEQGRAAV